MSYFDEELMESVLMSLDDDLDDDESVIDPMDEMSLLEAEIDLEIAEACKKEGKGVCEKCGKPLSKCECSGSKSVKTESDDDLDDDDYDEDMEEYM